MEDKRNTIAALLRVAGRAHHQAFIETDGDDPDWPDWYASYLSANLNTMLETKLEHTQLRDLLVELDQSQRAEAPDGDWTHFYAERLLDRYA